MFRVSMFAIAASLLTISSASAQNSVLSEFYGRGVHAFYSNDYTAATDYLSKAIDGGIKDPRAYYFRGLTSVASGREYEAELDYRTGAEMEAAGAFGSIIGQSLSRIQGSCRMEIENMRQLARLEYQASAAARSKARYQELEAAEEASMVKPAERKPAPATPPRVAPAAGDDPFDDKAAGKPMVESKDVLEGTMTDPFADDATPGAAPADAPPAGNDPFGAPAAPASDPFGEAAPAADDPFGGADPFGN